MLLNPHHHSQLLNLPAHVHITIQTPYQNLLNPTMPSFPPTPAFTPTSLIDLSTKVYILTLPAFPLARILYSLHATLYLPVALIPLLKASYPSSKGTLYPFFTGPSATAAVSAFLSQSYRLDVLFLSADAGDLETSFHLACLLLPTLRTTTSHFCHANPGIRIVWVATTPSAARTAYLLAHEFAAREHAQGANTFGVQHVVVHTTVQGSKVLRAVGRWLRGGRTEDELEACTLLYAGLAPGVRSGGWVVPWGRNGNVPEGVMEGTRKYGDESVSAVLYEWYMERRRKLVSFRDEQPTTNKGAVV
jgi:retinol dehydrogenase-12